MVKGSIDKDITLDTLIRKCEGNPAEAHDGTVVVFDHGRKEVLPKVPWFGLGRTIENYIVQTDVFTTDRVVRCPLRSARSAAIDTVMLYAEYSLSCPRGKQERAAAALLGEAGSGGDLTSAWERRLLGYVEDLAEGQARAGRDLLFDFFERREEIVQQLVARVAAETGLSIRLRLQLDGEAPLNRLLSLDVSTGSFDVRPARFDGDLTLQVRGRLRVEDARKSHALIRLLAVKEDDQALGADIARDLKEAVRSFVATELEIEDFQAQRLERTRTRLHTRLNDLLRDRHGRAFDFVDIALPQAGGQPPERVLFELITHVKPRDSRNELPIISDVAMQLENPARFQAMRQRDPLAADPEAWLKQHLEHIVRDALFNWTYSDLILKLDNEHIRVPLAGKAQELGYSVKHYSAVPEQPVLRLKRDGVRFETGEVSFATRDTRVNVALDIAVAAEMPPSLVAIERFIRPEINLIDEMRQAVVDAVRQELHTITPEAFYTQFSSVDAVPDALTGPVEHIAGRNAPMQERLTQPVEQLIRKTIEERLDQMFRLRNIQVIPKMADTTLTRRYMRLCNGVHDLVVEVESLADGGRSAPVPFLVSFKISAMAPNGWTVFQANGYDPDRPDIEIAAIKRELLANLRTSLSLLPPYVLEYRNEREWSQVHESARVAQKVIEKAFGLSITFINFRRDRTDDEKLEQIRQNSARQNLEQQVKAALQDIAAMRQADSKDLQAIRDVLNRRLQEGLPPNDPDVQAYLSIINQRREATRDLLAYKAPERPAEPGATDVDVLRHVGSLLEPGARVIEIAHERRTKADGQNQAQEPADSADAPPGSAS